MFPEIENIFFDRISDEVHGISKAEKIDVSHSKPVLIGEAIIQILKFQELPGHSPRWIKKVKLCTTMFMF